MNIRGIFCLGDVAQTITSLTIKSLRIVPDDDFLIGILFGIALAPTHFYRRNLAGWRSLVAVDTSQNHLFLCGDRGLRLWEIIGYNLDHLNRRNGILVWKCVSGNRPPLDLLFGKR